MQFEVSNRNKIIINFVNVKKEIQEEEEIMEGKEEEGVEPQTVEQGPKDNKNEKKAKKGFFGRLFSGSKNKKRKNEAKQKNSSTGNSQGTKETRKFENVRIINSQNEKEKLFGDFHRSIYNNYIQKLMRVINKHENIKISSEISKMNSFLSNTCTNKELNKTLNITKEKQTKKEPQSGKKEGIIKEESFEKITSSELENWYFDLESLTKIVDCLN
jgi:hypothetical protein